LLQRRQKKQPLSWRTPLCGEQKTFGAKAFIALLEGVSEDGNNFNQNLKYREMTRMEPWINLC
jgi:hypothetical protein